MMGITHVSVLPGHANLVVQPDGDRVCFSIWSVDTGRELWIKLDRDAVERIANQLTCWLNNNKSTSGMETKQ